MNAQDRNKHICARSCPERSHEIEGKGKGAHRTGVGTDVLAHVLGAHVTTKGEEEGAHRMGTSTCVLAHVPSVRISTARRMSCITYRTSHRLTVASTSIRQSPTSMEVRDC